MTVRDKARRDTAPALFRLLTECNLARAALECCGAAVLIVDARASKPVVCHANAAFETLFGHAADQAAGKDLATLLFRGDAHLAARLAANPRRWEVSAWAKDGSERAVDLTVSGVRDADGSLTHWILSFSDRSEVERLRAEVEALKGRPPTLPRVKMEEERPSRADFRSVELLGSR